MSTKFLRSPAALMAVALAAAAQAQTSSSPLPDPQPCSPVATPNPVLSTGQMQLNARCIGQEDSISSSQVTEYRFWSSALQFDESNFGGDGGGSPVKTILPYAGKSSGRYRVDVSLRYRVESSSSSSSSSGGQTIYYIRTGSVEVDYQLDAELALLSGAGQVPRTGVPLTEDFVVAVGDRSRVQGESRRGDVVKTTAAPTISIPVAGEQVRWYTYIRGDEASRVLLATTTTDSNGRARYRFTPPDENANRVVIAELPNAARVAVAGTTAANSVQFALGGGLQQEDVNRIQAQAEFMRQSMINSLRTQFGNVQQRLRYLRLQESRPGFRNELRVRVDNGAVPLGDDKTKRDDAGRVAAYVMGDIDVQELAANGQGQRVDISTNGLTLGGDYRLNNQVAFGGALGYTRGSADLSGGAGEQKAGGGSLTVYGLYAPTNSVYVDFALAHGRNSFDLQRLQSTGGFATGSTDGSATGLTLGGGYDVRFGSWSLTPFAKIEYISARIDGYTESGSAAVSVTDQRITATTGAVGAELQYAWSQTWGVVIPHLRLDWQYQEQRDKREVTATLVGSSFFAALPLRELDRNYGTIGAGVSAQFGKGMAAFLDYERTFARQSVQQYRTMAGMKFEF